jgi:hypothetical protein
MAADGDLINQVSFDAGATHKHWDAGVFLVGALLASVHSVRANVVALQG